jgi:hypothetical protein
LNENRFLYGTPVIEPDRDIRPIGGLMADAAEAMIGGTAGIFAAKASRGLESAALEPGVIGSACGGDVMEPADNE